MLGVMPPEIEKAFAHAVTLAAAVLANGKAPFSPTDAGRAQMAGLIQQMYLAVVEAQELVRNQARDT